MFIPVMESNEVVAVDVNELPEEPEDLLEILAAEAAPLGACMNSYASSFRR